MLANNAFNTVDANPRDCVEYTTIAANGSCGVNESINNKYWPTNTTYVYTGYIWNRSPTNETWTFAEHFDDSVKLTVGATLVIPSGNGWSVSTRGDATLKPGANYFEVRFGQGTGTAGASTLRAGDTDQWWDGFNRDRSFAIDFQGRNSTDISHYEIPVDDGTGYLFTRTPVDPFGDGDYLAAAEVRLAPGAILDLNGKTNVVGLLIGSANGIGIVSNGVLKAGTVISPAGDTAIGILNLEGVTFQAGAQYRVTAAGTESDLLTSSGVLDVTGLVIVPADGTELTEVTYVIARATGSITGKATPGPGIPSKYKVMRSGNELWLTSLGGTLMILK